MESLTPHEAVFKRFFEAAEIANFTPNEMRDYRESQKEMWDMYAITTTAEAKGERKGIEKGIAQGRAEGRIEERYVIARNLLNLKLPIDQVVRATGLSEEEIRSIE